MNFKKSLAIFLCLALLFTSGAGAAFASAKVSAKILSLEGDVQVVRAGGEKPFKAFVNMRLTEGDRIITGTDGIAQIQMDDELVITLTENTRIYLSELRGSGGAQQTSIDLQAGGVGSAVNKKLEESSRFEIKTPTAVMGVRGTEFFTQYFAGNVDVRVVDGFVEVTVELSETGQVAGGGGSTWSGGGAGSGAPAGPGAETFSFQLGPLEQVLFAEGDQGSQLPGQIAGLALEGMPEKFIERIQEIEKDQPGKIPESILDKIEEAVQGALDKLREQEAVAQGTRGEYDFRYTAHIVDGDLERGLPGFAPEDMDIPPLEPEPVDTGGGGGGSRPSEPNYSEDGIIVHYSTNWQFEVYGVLESNQVNMESDTYFFRIMIGIDEYEDVLVEFTDSVGEPLDLQLDNTTLVSTEGLSLTEGHYFMKITVITDAGGVIREIEIIV